MKRGGPVPEGQRTVRTRVGGNRRAPEDAPVARLPGDDENPELELAGGLLLPGCALQRRLAHGSKPVPLDEQAEFLQGEVTALSEIVREKSLSAERRTALVTHAVEHLGFDVDSFAAPPHSEPLTGALSLVERAPEDGGLDKGDAVRPSHSPCIPRHAYTHKPRPPCAPPPPSGSCPSQPHC
jgi:hypothetical protein